MTQLIESLTSVYGCLGLVLLVLLFLAKRHFNGGVNQYYPKLEGKVIIVTGANTGLGYECAKQFSKLGAKAVIMACRDNTRGQNAADKIKNELGVTNVEYMKCDLCDLESVQTFVEKFKAKYDRLDILVNNAGLFSLQKRQTTKQGYEKVMGLQLGHFFLTNSLYDMLSAAGKSRVVNTSSYVHCLGTNSLDFDDLMIEKNYKGNRGYHNSKLSVVYFTRQLAQLIKESGMDNQIKTCSLHPGSVRGTEHNRYVFEGRLMLYITLMYIMYPMYWFTSKNPWQGAQTTMHCCLCPFEELQNGLYYSDCEVKPETLNPNWKEEAQKLQEWSAKAVAKFVN